MTIDEAIEAVSKRFPFDGYIPVGEGASSAWVNIARTVQRHVPRGARVLDFGCGPCDKTAVLQMLGYDCSACDDLQDGWHGIDGNRDSLVTFARECGIDFRLVTDGVIPFEEPVFDLVMMNDVLEHLHDSPRDLLNSLLRLVKPLGAFFMTVPNAVNIRKRLSVLLGRTNLASFEKYYWHPNPWRGHIREYTRDDTAKLARFLGLEVVELRSCHHMLTKLPRCALPLYRALTRVFPGWRDTWLLVARKPEGWTPRVLSQEEQATVVMEATGWTRRRRLAGSPAGGGVELRRCRSMPPGLLRLGLCSIVLS